MIGHPVAHSLSPVMHRAAYRALDLTGWTYEAVDVEESAIGAFLDGLDADWAGLSVTMPLKRAVRPYLDSESELAVAVGAVNTVVLDGDGRHGHNTDVHGIVAALAEAGATHAEHAVVLGGGATAASTLAALQRLGCTTPTVLVRSAARCTDLLAASERLGVRPVLVPLTAEQARISAVELGERGGVLVSTLPAGTADDLAEPLASAVAGAAAAAGRPVPALLDVVYAPWPTVLGSRWVAGGGPVAGGFAMLVNQAEDQVRLMTGRHAPLEIMRIAGQAELAARTPVD